MRRHALIAVARGERPADLLLRRARIVNTFTAEVEEGTVALCQGYVAGIGDYRQGKRVLDLEGRYLLPGFINGHTHLESSLLTLEQYARAVVPRGTLAVVTDLHEIANVSGLAGIRALLAASRRLPLDLFLMAPSCVPPTARESAGARLGVQEVRAILRWAQTLGLGEVMCVPQVLAGDAEVLRKVQAAGTRPVDGHAPGLSGKALNAYLCAGIRSCHESTSLEEGREKLRRGMFLMLREGTAEKNLEALLPLVNADTYPRCLLVVDDRSCVDLLHDGDLDAVVRKAIALGLEPVRAIQLATLNPARYFGLPDLGAVAPGYRANLLVVGDLRALDVQLVLYRGRVVARDGQPLFSPRPLVAAVLEHTVHVKPFALADLTLRDRPGPFPVIEVIPGQILTRKRLLEPTRRDGAIVADPARDLLKAVVVERHHASGRLGLGLVKGFGLRRGALASSVAHDTHQLVAVGASDTDLYVALQEVIRLQGGLVVAAGGQVLEALPLPIAGLLSPQPLEAVAAALQRLEAQAAALGATLPAPFATLSFLALPVIPELRLTDRGLVEVGDGQARYVR
ncbi:MAG: adenine deaminase [Candidatus Tectimicrobiota bacterium]|nr:MAG: adenine deaminase [Candidatus Tectomicrobia bacterium]